MKKVFFQTFVFLLLLFVADRIVGFTLKKLYETSNNLEIAKIRYTIDSTHQDILIFGSSTAQHHYIPDTITKYTSKSVYNCGIGGQGIAFSFIQLHETLKRYKPQLIILDLSPVILLDKLSDQKLKILLPYYSKDPAIENIITSGSIIEKTKFLSKLYPYNGTIYSTLSAFVYYRADNEKGYIPIIGVIDTTGINNVIQSKNQIELHNNQIQYLYKIIAECKLKHIELMFIISPLYRVSEKEMHVIELIKSIAQKNSISFNDFSNNKNFRQQNTLFKDNLHLNHFGSAKFTCEVSKYIQMSFNR